MKNELIEIFCGFWIFEYALWVKTKTRASMLGFVDNFEQYFESCVLNTQNSFKRAPTKVNDLITSKNEAIKIVRCFRVFEYALWQETKTQKGRKSTKDVLN